MFTVGDNMRIQVWSEGTLIEEPQIQLIDDEIKEKLGAENL